MKKLKLVTAEQPGRNDVLFIEDEGYLKYGSVVLDKGGTEGNELVRCSDLKTTLEKYLFKGTKFIASSYNPTLYYLIPGVQENDALFTSDNNFIPTLPVSDLVRLEVDGFNIGTGITQDDTRSIKACDSWFNDLSKYKEIVGKLDKRVNSILSYYRSYDIDKEVLNEDGNYSADLSENSLVVSLISGTTYTDTINLEDWILASKKGTYPISGKLDLSYMYSIGGEIYSGMQTIKAFRYEESITSDNKIINLPPIQIEYIDNVLKIYPLEEEIDEVVFTDCTLTIGCL